MKKIGLLFFMLFLILGGYQSTLAQDYSVRLTIFEPLPEVDFAAFAVTNNLRGAPRIISIEIEPQGARVILEGRIMWKRNNQVGEQELFYFVTEPFVARNLTNNEIGTSDIRLRESRSNPSLTEENIRKGRPTGVYIFEVILKDANGGEQARDSKQISFTNPSQTLTIQSPEAGSYQDIGSVVAQWNNIIGAASYEIKANVRRNTSQSLEEALNQGTPIIDHANVGNMTVANLRSYMSRELLPGQEGVLQVSAYIPGPSGGSWLYSNIVNFFIRSSSDAGAVNQEIEDLLQLISDITGQDLVTKYREGQIDMSNMRITLDDGRILTIVELREILNYLKTNPDNIVSVSFINR
ncbi:MAG: hypothetical protein A2V66_05015 [Ignavibacteria bacterium RBG_13_36_8]|nr:MAG: hypothetical protein A2V66_05015 [Ignavibacteria bacterium RBG_13_36_8]